MSFSNDMLKEITFFIPHTDEEVTLYKLGKIGIKKGDLSIRTLPPSSLRRNYNYVVEVNNEQYLRCVNCDHIRISHEKNDEGFQICYGLDDDRKNCNCRKYISIDGNSL